MTVRVAILGIGGAHIDRRGQVSGAFVTAASNPGIMREEVGGGMFNALRTAVRRGASASLVSLRGGDAAGTTVERAIADAGIEDLSCVFLDRLTPSYTALLDRDGDLIAGLADMHLYDLAFARQMRRSKMRLAIRSADAVLADANLPEAALDGLTAMTGGKPVFAIAISPAKAARLLPVLDKLALVFLNRREAAALTALDTDAPAADMVAALKLRGMNAAVVTGGAGPAIVFDRQDAYAMVPPVPRRIADVTGAGDALAGATSTALLAGKPLAEAVREGLAAALLAVETPQAVPDFSARQFGEALALVPMPRPL